MRRKPIQHHIDALAALLLLSGVVVKLTQDYFSRAKK